MLELEIDGKSVSIPSGATVLAAAAHAGIRIPVLCHLDGFLPHTSCMVCLVRDMTANKLIPSCSAPAENGMVIETRGADIESARKEVLDLLLGEHVGDCEGPCRRACPAGLDIPTMHHHLNQGQRGSARRLVRSQLPLAGVLSRICPAPCEKVCRRARIDEPVAIQTLVRDLADDSEGMPAAGTRGGNSGFLAAVIGAGPAGLSAAGRLAELGHLCHLIDAGEAVGGGLNQAMRGSQKEVLEKETRLITQNLDGLRLNTCLGRDVGLPELEAKYDAVILATGNLKGELIGYLMEQGIRSDGSVMSVDANKVQERSLFGAGAVSRATRMTVRAVADGRAAADAVDRFLKNLSEEDRESKPFDSRIGRLEIDECGGLLPTHLSEAVAPAASTVSSVFSVDATASEAARCLRCACGKKDGCDLRNLATEYRADGKDFKGEARSRLRRIVGRGSLVLEPGKCIKCGRCVNISGSEEWGLTFRGRGFPLEVGVPFGESLQNALVETAAACVKNCPTGALTGEEPG